LKGRGLNLPNENFLPKPLAPNFIFLHLDAAAIADFPKLINKYNLNALIMKESRCCFLYASMAAEGAACPLFKPVSSGAKIDCQIWKMERSTGLQA